MAQLRTVARLGHLSNLTVSTSLITFMAQVCVLMSGRIGLMPDFYDFNQGDQLWYHRGEQPPIGYTLELLTRGRYTVVAGAIHDTLSTDPHRADLPATEAHSLTVDEQGNWWLGSLTDSSQINTMAKGHMSWKGVASGTVRLPTGHVVTLDNQIFAVTKFNRQLWVRDVADPKRSDFIQVDVDRVTGQPVPNERVPRNYRPATAEEAMTYGIAGLLASRYSGAVQALVDRARQAKK